MKIILRIGGSVLGSPPDPPAVNGYAEVVTELNRQGHVVGIIVGGGEVSRRYIESARQLGLSAYYQDVVAIHASRLNARLVGLRLGSTASVPASVNGMVTRLRKGRVAVMGGLRPGITTDTVATLVARAWKPDLFIKASNQAGVYTADPKVDRDAELLTAVSYERLGEILGGKHKPGIHSIIDPVAIELLTRGRFNLVVVDGREPSNVLKVVEGRRIGTRVS